MTSSTSAFRAPTSSIEHRVRGVYYPTQDGLRLARIESFSRPFFREDGWEDCDPSPVPPRGGAQEREPLAPDPVENLRRAVRRAKQNAFDIILCNPDIDLFATLTYAPDAVEDKSSYKECYRYLNTFFSNRVQRRGLKYVCAPELTKAGDVHFHFLCNAGGVGRLERAISPYTGRALTHKGKALYNLAEWSRGFSSAEYISPDESARDAVAKYLFKYIGKDVANKVGGRYLLTGGALARPVYRYGDCIEDISTETPKFEKNVQITAGLSYNARYFV